MNSAIGDTAPPLPEWVTWTILGLALVGALTVATGAVWAVVKVVEWMR